METYLQVHPLLRLSPARVYGAKEKDSEKEVGSDRRESAEQDSATWEHVAAIE